MLDMFYRLEDSCDQLGDILEKRRVHLFLLFVIGRTTVCNLVFTARSRSDLPASVDGRILLG